MSPPERMQALGLVEAACASGARKQKACELLGISVRTLERWQKPSGAEDKRPISKRPKQANQLSDEERRMLITVANSEPYRDLPPSKIVPLLADEGRYIASESSFYRVLRKEKQLAHRQSSKPAAHHKPQALTATAPNTVWSWDISYLSKTVFGQYFYLYVIMDIFSRKIVGWHVHERESGEFAAALMKQACLDEQVGRGQVYLHSDNGKPMKGASMLAMLESLGVMPSFSRPSVSDDNPYSESLFRTVKYHPTFPLKTRFDTMSEARSWMETFVIWYNTEHLHSGLKFITPEQRHKRGDKVILEKRHHVYELAKRNKPERWSRNTRNWTLPESVTLNPNKKNNNKFNFKNKNELEMAA